MEQSEAQSYDGRCASRLCHCKNLFECPNFSIQIDLTATEIKQVKELIELQKKVGIDSPL